MKHFLYFSNTIHEPLFQSYFLLFDITITIIPSIHQYNHITIQPIDFVLLDESLIASNHDSLNVLKTYFKTPIIILTTDKNDQNVVDLLNLGADDVVLSTIHPRELYARIQAILRRMQHLYEKKEVLVYEFGEFIFDINARELKHKINGLVLLTQSEIDLLTIFLGSRQKVLSREELLLLLNQPNIYTIKRRIDVHISRLRQKLLQASNGLTYIKTIRGEGYFFSVDSIAKNKK